ncbi:MAG: heparan-alpha-glucosaminide N-acetyltransferase domain-containing protein [Saprospiraceae bacterium]
MISQTFHKNRIQSIDILRGLVMVIMALDHVRDFFFKADISDGGGSLATSPTDLDTTTPALFFTRWITHFCAPIFLLLAGTSAYLITQKKPLKEVSLFLLKRGIWLVFVEIIIITFGWTFNPLFNVLILQVIWAIGISMILLSFIIYLPFRIIFLIGVLIVIGHNLLDYSIIKTALQGGFLSDLIYFANFSAYELGTNHMLMIVYAFLPWTGVMILGYCLGKIFENHVDAEKRKKYLWRGGVSLLLLFIIVRTLNGYGDPMPWGSHHRGGFFTFLSFINVNKYPPSLDFLSLTLGIGMLLLLMFENLQNKLTTVFNIYGRVPFFYYVLHFYIIHLIAVIIFFINGFASSQIVTPGSPFFFRPPELGYGLIGVYVIWIIVVLILYPMCKKYDIYKTSHIKLKWWLRYF